MSQIAEYILAKKALAELDACPFRDTQMTPVELADDRVYGYFGIPAKPAIANLIGGVLLLGSITRGTYAEPFVGNFSSEMIAISSSQSDSQQLSQREQRARSIRTVSLQAKANVVRVFEFERPFPEEESSYNPPLPQLPRTLKLKR
jgi:hypothetical protein